MKTLSSILLLFLALSAQATNTVYFVFSDFGGGVGYFSQTNVILTAKPLSAPTVIGNRTILPDWIRMTNNASGSSTGLFHAGVYRCTITAKNTEANFNINVTNSATPINAASIITVPTNTVSGTGQALSAASSHSIFIEDPATKSTGQFLSWDGSDWVASSSSPGGGSGDVTTAQLLAQGANNTNFARGTIGLASTNAIKSAGTESTNFARGTIGLALTNAVNDLAATTSIGLADLSDALTTQLLGTNTALLLQLGTLGTNSTNFARGTIGLAATNAIAAAGTASTNFALGIGLAGTNNVNSTGTASTNFARGTIGLASTNYTDSKIATLGTALTNAVNGVAGGGGSGQYVTNRNGTITNGLTFDSGDGNALQNALVQAGSSFMLSNHINGVQMIYNEDSQAFTFYSDINGVNLNLSGNFSADTFNVSTVNLSNALGVASGGTGLTNLGTNTVVIGNGTNPPSRLAPGTDGKVLTMVSGSPAWATASGGSSSFTTLSVTNSTTNATVLDVSAYSLIRVYLLTNANVVLTNATSLATRAQIYFQQDTNGGRLLDSFKVAGGLIQTNTSLQPTTNANALDVLEVMPGFFTTNLVAWWPQNFQPRVAFTNSLAAGGGGGGGGLTHLKTYSNPVYVYDPVNPLPWPITATSLTISAGGSWPAGTYLINGGIESFSTADGNQTLYSLLSFTAAAGISGGVYTIDP